MIKVDVIRDTVTYVGLIGKDLDDIKQKLKTEKGLSDYGVSKCKFIYREDFYCEE